MHTHFEELDYLIKVQEVAKIIKKMNQENCIKLIGEVAKITGYKDMNKYIEAASQYIQIVENNKETEAC